MSPARTFRTHPQGSHIEAEAPICVCQALHEITESQASSAPFRRCRRLLASMLGLEIIPLMRQLDQPQQLQKPLPKVWSQQPLLRLYGLQHSESHWAESPVRPCLPLCQQLSWLRRSRWQVKNHHTIRSWPRNLLRRLTLQVHSQGNNNY